MLFPFEFERSPGPPARFSRDKQRLSTQLVDIIPHFSGWSLSFPTCNQEPHHLSIALRVNRFANRPFDSPLALTLCFTKHDVHLPLRSLLFISQNVPLRLIPSIGIPGNATLGPLKILLERSTSSFCFLALSVPLNHLFLCETILHYCSVCCVFCYWSVDNPLSRPFAGLMRFSYLFYAGGAL